RQPYHGRMAALDTRDEHRSQALDSIAACLVLRLTSMPIGADLVIADTAHLDLTDHNGLDDLSLAPVCGPHHSHSRQHLVATPRKHAQHGEGILLTLGLAKNDTITYHSRIGTEHSQLT